MANAGTINAAGSLGTRLAASPIECPPSSCGPPGLEHVTAARLSRRILMAWSRRARTPDVGLPPRRRSVNSSAVAVRASSGPGAEGPLLVHAILLVPDPCGSPARIDRRRFPSDPRVRVPLGLRGEDTRG